MQEFLEYVVKGLVQHADAVRVTPVERAGMTVYELRLDKSDVGKIIGRQGVTINAIRSLLLAGSAKKGLRCSVEIVEESRGQVVSSQWSAAARELFYYGLLTTDYGRMKIDVLTLFPAMFAGPLDESIVKRARAAGLLDLKIHNLRDWAHDRHKTVDDRPFGGGPGMLLKPEPLFEAIEGLKREKTRVILLSPAGRQFNQAIARELAEQQDLLLVTGHYEGFDERVREKLADDELSIGDYVLTNGALPAMVVIDAVVRLLPGALGDDASSYDESFSHGLLEYPQYTRPAEFRGMKVPDILVSGNHAEIEKWRREQAKSQTKKRRPDLLK